jgi:hypothetical protein
MRPSESQGFAEQAGLPDPGFPGEEQEATVATRGRGHREGDVFELGRPTDERATGALLHCHSKHPPRPLPPARVARRVQNRRSPTTTAPAGERSPKGAPYGPTTLEGLFHRVQESL